MPSIDDVLSNLYDIRDSATSAANEIEEVVSVMDGSEDGDNLTSDARHEIIDGIERARNTLQGPRSIADSIAELGEVELIWTNLPVVES